MFFNRYQRIKTQPKIPGRLDDQFRSNKHKLKIKNIRFSLDHTLPKSNEMTQQIRELQSMEYENEKELGPNCRKKIFLDKLPQLSVQTKEVQHEGMLQRHNFSFQQHKKKDALLNSILEILKPSVNVEEQKFKVSKGSTQFKRDRFKRLQIPAKEFVNEFIQQNSVNQSTKYRRSPKIIQNQVLNFRNNNNVVRRKIYSEQKGRMRADRDMLETLKQSQDLQKIQILTFANKFPKFKKSEENKD